jgi:hypothetical protein
MTTLSLQRSLRNLSVIAAACAAIGAQAAPWTTIGSAGVVDEADLSIYSFVNGEARLTAAAPAGSELNLRYNMVALDGFSPGLNQSIWTVRYIDTGAQSRVLMALRQYNIYTGITSTLATFDSNAFPAAPGYQTRNVCIAPNWNFGNGPFFVEAALSRSGAAAGIAPGLGSMKVEVDNCTP